jgi:hypothetical protein
MLVATGHAQHFKVNNISKVYDFAIDVSGKVDGYWTGPVKVSVYKKNSNRIVQILPQAQTFINADSPEFTTIDKKKNGKWSDLYSVDLNFDGHEDIAIVDGKDGGYSSTSYSIYLYDDRRHRFIYSRRFSKLAHGVYMGMPEPDAKKRTLYVFWESTCCEHFQEWYHVDNGTLRLVKKVSNWENPMSDPGFNVTETRTLIRGKWRVVTRRKKI